MAENNNAAESIEVSTGIASTIAKGKNAAGIAKGIASGNPYAAIALGIWLHRGSAVKIIAMILLILMLPILFLLMLPSIIFGDIDKNTAVMNDNTALIANISNAESAINDILTQKHEEILSKIKSEIPEGTTYKINDSFENMELNTYLIIAQYCVSKDNYKDVNITNLKGIVNKHKNNLFSYSKDGTTYTITFVGEDYFADKIFKLSKEQKKYAKEYASNLSLFMDSKSMDSSDWEDIPGGDNGTFQTPFPGKDWKSCITSPFGWRTHPISGIRRYHSGLDIGMPYGTPVKASKEGIVITAVKQNYGYGYHVIIKHGNGYTTLYGHNSELLVKTGDKVKQGQVISLVGSTGYSTGPHCHFEVLKDGKQLDPMQFIGK